MAFKMKGFSPFTQKTTEPENKPLCAKCGKPAKGHDDSTHAFTTNPDDPDYEGGDTFDVKPKNK